MNTPKGFSSYRRHTKFIVAVGSTVTAAWYAVASTRQYVSSVVRSSILERDKATPEYIYTDDPVHKLENPDTKVEREGLSELKWSLMRRLLWMCENGDREHRSIALQQIANIKNVNEWTFAKMSFAMNANTAVLLARTQGADYRYFRPAPMYIRRLASCSENRFSRYLQIVDALNKKTPHGCTDTFIKSYLNTKKVRKMDESDQNDETQRRLCINTMEAVQHHLFQTDDNSDKVSKVHLSILEMASEILERYKQDKEVEMSALRLMNVISARHESLHNYHIYGLLRHLTRWLHSREPRFCCTAATTLANLAGEGHYRGGLYLLHPLYRDLPYYTDVLFIHGLRGGVFVTWRQRDEHTSELGIIETVLQSGDNSEKYDTFEECEKDTSDSFIDLEIGQVMPELERSRHMLETDRLLADYDVVLRDLPESVSRADHLDEWTALEKRQALDMEEQDLCSKTSCWPKDWLPKDCPNIRVLGVEYTSAVSSWGGSCSGGDDTRQRAGKLQQTLVSAGVGRAPYVAVAHSMGGLVLQRTLLSFARSDSAVERAAAANLRALILLSTPHRGSPLATLHRGTAALLWVTPIVKELQKGSPKLLEQQNEFVAACEEFGWRTVCFGETKATLVSPFKVPIQFVEEDSSDLGRGLFYKVPLDHLSICKPASRLSLVYITIVDIVKKVTEEEIMKRKSVTRNSLQGILNYLKTLRRNFRARDQIVDETSLN